MTTFDLNGRTVSVRSPEDTPLLWAIRDEIGLKGTKFGCGIGMCGACTVHVDGRATRSCITALGAVAGANDHHHRRAAPRGQHPLQTAWIELQVPQCGYCQSGQIMQAATLLKDYPDPTDQDINAVMAGNLCRCMTYVRIRKAIKLAASRMQRSSHAETCAMQPVATPTRRAVAPDFLIATMGPASCSASHGHAWRPSNCPVRGRPGETAPSDLFEPTIWYSIDRNGAVTVNIIRAEMGQHVGTALARIVADELEADWNKVRIVHVDSDPKWGLMVTGGSWSVWQSFPASQPGRRGRPHRPDRRGRQASRRRTQAPAPHATALLIAAQKSIDRYGDIVARGDLRRSYTPEQLKQMPIKPAAERRLIGRDTIAIDIPPKTNGEARYGLDAVVDGMIYARPKVPPTRNDSKVVSIDDSAAKQRARLHPEPGPG